MSNKMVWFWIWFYVLNIVLDIVILVNYHTLFIQFIWFIILAIDVFFMVDLYCNHLEKGENE